MDYTLKQIAHIETDFPSKFGIPRQAGIADALEGTVVFEPEYRNETALKGLEDFSHIWVIWQFSEAVSETWSPTVRPPRLGGNVRKGVFATRSPFRPNALGLSSLKLTGIEKTKDRGTVLRVSGADMMNGTPIYDIKPYIPYADCHPEALQGFAPDSGGRLEVVFETAPPDLLGQKKLKALTQVLENDPRPRYQQDPDRVYGFSFAGYEIRFMVNGQILTVKAIEKI